MICRHSIVVRHSDGGEYRTRVMLLPTLRLVLRAVRIALRHGEDYCPTAVDLGLVEVGS